MRFILYLSLILLISSHGAVEKDLNLSALKKAYSWLLEASEESLSLKSRTVSDLSKIDELWDSYKDLMKQSIVLIRKHPKKINERLPALLNHVNRDIFPLIAFYLFCVERQNKTLRYYDAFNVTVVPMNHDNLWIAAIPFKDSTVSGYTNYSILIMDFNNKRVLTKD